MEDPKVYWMVEKIQSYVIKEKLHLEVKVDDDGVELFLLSKDDYPIYATSKISILYGFIQGYISGKAES